MYKYLKLIYNVLQCVVCNSSKCHYLEPLRKGFIAKMTYLVEFWLILESELVERAAHENLLYGSENGTQCSLVSFTQFL